ncbi:Alpha/Beta hydrolase protein [Chlamydoabsidia padenii]|nr:Alpha/Beta hydrolase protein [Chlamydoabsidia padenii]
MKDNYLYLFYPSHNKASDDPLILWLNGGPGCHSMKGALASIGPCLLTPDGNNTLPNPYTWNEYASLLFLDQIKAIGTGSGDDNSTSVTPSLAAKQIYLILQKYRPKSLVIAGESHAGIYLAALSDLVLRQNRLIERGIRKGTHLPLKSIIIGNAWTGPQTLLTNHHTFECDKDSKGRCDKMESSSYSQSLMAPSQSKWISIPSGIYCEHTPLDPYVAKDNVKRCPHEKYIYAIEQSLEPNANNQDPLTDYSPSIVRALHQGIAVLIYTGDKHWRRNKAWALAMNWNGKQEFNTVKDEEVYTHGMEIPTGQARSFDKLTFLHVFDAGKTAISDQPVVFKDFIMEKWLKDFV